MLKLNSVKNFINVSKNLSNKSREGSETLCWTVLNIIFSNNKTKT